MDFKRITSALLLTAPLVLTQAVQASDRMYEITITNITGGEIFTPLLVASHNRHVQLFSAGEAAGNELEQLAEGGDTAPLSALLTASGADVMTTDGVLPPGESVTVHLDADSYNNRISVAAMLVPSNDAFVALNGVRAPREGRSKTYTVRAYDAGTEHNDEMCVSIPGPPFICTGEGYNPEGGEGYVYTHPGIHGIGDLPAYAHDWNNPVATITIKQLRN